MNMLKNAMQSSALQNNIDFSAKYAVKIAPSAAPKTKKMTIS